MALLTSRNQGELPMHRGEESSVCAKHKQTVLYTPPRTALWTVGCSTGMKVEDASSKNCANISQDKRINCIWGKSKVFTYKEAIFCTGSLDCLLIRVWLYEFHQSEEIQDKCSLFRFSQPDYPKLQYLSTGIFIHKKKSPPRRSHLPQ